MTRSTTLKAILALGVLLATGGAIYFASGRAETPQPPPAGAAPGGSTGSVSAAAAAITSQTCVMSPCGTAACDQCTVENCIPSTDGCGRIDDPADRKLCEELYACITDPANHCTNQGDPVRCWCGTHPTTCLGHATGPLAGDGPCAQKILAAGKSTDPEDIRKRFVDAVFPLGRAVKLSHCRGSFCSAVCGVP